MKLSKKELIIEIAYHSFVEKGYENTNIRLICKAARVEPPTIYYYFKSKKELFLSIVRCLNENYDGLFKKLKLLDSGMEPQDKLFELFRFNLSYARANPSYTKFFVRYSLFAPDEVAEDFLALQSEISKERNEIEDKIFEECLQKGFISIDRLDAARKTFDMFVENHTYDTVMFDYCPSDEELPQIWEYFLNYRLLKS